MAAILEDVWLMIYHIELCISTNVNAADVSSPWTEEMLTENQNVLFVKLILNPY